MTYPTDMKAVLSISMGAVGGEQIGQQHRICIDEIHLDKSKLLLFKISLQATSAVVQRLRSFNPEFPA